MAIELKTTQPVTRFAAVIVVKLFFHKMVTSVLVMIVLSFYLFLAVVMII